DQLVKRYETYEQLLGYCRCSANPVGRLVLYLCESFDQERAVLSDLICTGLQLANFWQDVARDLDIGRVYLPAEDRRRFGYSDEDLEARRFTPAFAELIRFELTRARALFDEGLALVPLVPDDVQTDIELFACCRPASAARCARCTPSCGLPTTSATSRDRSISSTCSCGAGARRCTRRSRATIATRHSPPCTIRLPSTRFRQRTLRR